MTRQPQDKTTRGQGSNKKTRQEKTRQDKARQDKRRQSKTTRQDKTRQDKTRQDKTRQDKTRHAQDNQKTITRQSRDKTRQPQDNRKTTAIDGNTKQKVRQTGDKRQENPIRRLDNKTRQETTIDSPPQRQETTIGSSRSILHHNRFSTKNLEIFQRGKEAAHRGVAA
jgi:hypothetical protein